MVRTTKKMKGGLAGLVAGLTMVGGVAYAQNVGDEMPDYEKANPMRVIAWKNQAGNPGGPLVHFHLDGKCKYNGVWNKCGSEIPDRPFGIYDIEKNVLYLDNAPTDGVIDEVVENPGSRKVRWDAPKCM